MVFGPYLLCSFKDVLSSASQDHGGGSGILRRLLLRFRQMRAFWNAQDLLLRTHEAAPDRQVILPTGMLTS